MIKQNSITFTTLTKKHLPYLQEWLNKSHVNPWWGNKVWTADEINKKYRPYTHPNSKVKAHIIEIDTMPIGYIQYYKISDFPDNLPFDIDPEMAGIDFLIGDEKYLGTGISRLAITQYINEIMPIQFTKFIADPSVKNLRCITFLKKLGFVETAKNNGMLYLQFTR